MFTLVSNSHFRQTWIYRGNSLISNTVTFQLFSTHFFSETFIHLYILIYELCVCSPFVRNLELCPLKADSVEGSVSGECIYLPISLSDPTSSHPPLNLKSFFPGKQRQFTIIPVQTNKTVHNHTCPFKLSFLPQEIPLDSITSIEPAKVAKTSDLSRAPHVFEIHTAGGMTYCVGEDLSYGHQESNIVASAESGSGMEQARHWEQALRQGLMPVTPQSSGSKDDGEYCFFCYTVEHPIYDI